MTQARRPRVAIVVPELARRGGVPAVALFLHRVITESGRYEADLISLAMSARDENSVRVLAPASWFRGARVTRGEIDGLPFLHVGSIAAELEFCRYRPRAVLTRLLNDYDLVQVVAGTPAIVNAARDVTIPVLLQVATMVGVERAATLARTGGFRQMLARAMTRVTARLDERGLEHATLVFAENAWMFEMLSKRFPQRVLFAPPGIDTDTFRPPEEPVADGYILCVGRLKDHRKNVRMLIEAYAALRSQLPQTPRLVLAGHSGPSESDWASAVELRVASYIDVHVNPSLRELIALYQGAAVFALSSDEEGLGIVLLEAMASGLAAVATRCGGPEYSVIDGETGVLVPIGDASAMASALAGVLGDQTTRARMGRAARERAEVEFSLAATGRRFISAYDDVLAQPRRA